MVLKTSKNTKTCKEKANIWLRIGFDLWNMKSNLHMNAMKNRTAHYISALQSMKWKMIFAGYLIFIIVSDMMIRMCFESDI